MTGGVPWPDDRTVPATLAARPREGRQGLPVPPVSVHERDGAQIVDFTVVNGPTGLALALRRRCSLCGQAMGAAGFLGGPDAASQQRYLDPPGHPECLRAALHLCPFIKARNHRRARDSAVPTGPDPDGFVLGKPQSWVLAVTDTYGITLDDGVACYRPGAFTDLWVFGYDEHGRIRHLPSPDAVLPRA